MHLHLHLHLHLHFHLQLLTKPAGLDYTYHSIIMTFFFTLDIIIENFHCVSAGLLFMI